VTAHYPRKTCAPPEVVCIGTFTRDDADYAMEQI
jgi:hypothetical protein